MSTERWEHIQQIFEAALDAEEASRESLVRKECGSDDAMFAEVMALLAADAEGHPLLDNGSAFDLPFDEATLLGTLLGPFRLIDQIGSGGMGTVYLAERVDGQFEQRVAIKVVQPGLRTKIILRRFQQERQILARVNHPHIARLLDGGLTPDGRPYFVMEYVDGVPIDQYCRDQQLSLIERLHLFLQACEAVEFAHSNLVIHRDLKPANILVGSDNQVKVIDFGIAKVLQGSDEFGQDGLTMTGFRAMTPRYASPEQVRNQAITTATDVYSLGVVLYELLTGKYPYRATTDSGPELEHAVITQEPERPSSVVLRSDDKALRDTPADLATARKLRRLLRGDLDTICMAALRKDPARRYQAVRQLIDDIRRHLDGWPIEARMDSVSYMFGKFVRRHRGIVVAVAAAVVLIAVTIGFYTTRLAKQRDVARLEARKAKEIAKFLTGIFEVADPNESEGDMVTARELLDTATARLRVELANQPRVRATLMAVASDVYYNIGLLDEARDLAMEASAIRRTALNHDDPDNFSSLLQVARIQDEDGERDSALTAAREALGIATRIYAPDDTAMATCQIAMAYIHRHLGAFDSAGHYYNLALATQRAVLGDSDIEVGNTLNHLARLYSQQGDYARAEPVVREAIANLRANYGRDDHFEVIAALGNLGGILASQERYAEAESVFVHLRQCLAKVTGTNHVYYGGITNQLANAVYKQGRIEEAHKLYLEALRLAEKNLPSDHSFHVTTLLGLGRLLSEHGDFRDAEPMLRQAVDIRQRTLPAGHWQLALAESLMADCLRRAKKFDESAVFAGRSFEALRDKFGETDDRTREARQVLEAVYRDWQKPLPAGYQLSS